VVMERPIPALFGDLGNAVPARFQIAPEFIDVARLRKTNAQANDGNLRTGGRRWRNRGGQPRWLLQGGRGRRNRCTGSTKSTKFASSKSSKEGRN
jgi:hypothetical protein